MAPDRDFTRALAWADEELLFPGVLLRGARSFGVRRVQEHLAHLQLRAGAKTTLPIDGDFGPTTERLVRAIQGPAGLPETGVVDAPTWEVLVAPLRRAVAPLGSAVIGRSLNELVVLYAKQFIAESPVEIGGPNAGFWVRTVMLGHSGKIWKWCAGTACFWLTEACRDRQVPMPIAPSFGATELAKSAQARRRFSADGPPVPGDLFVLPEAGGTSWFHTGAVLSVIDAQHFLSAEGNTNREGGSDGEVARSVVRRIDRCDFLRVG